MLQEFLNNFLHNLFKPLLLFFYAGFLIPVFRVKFEFPKPVYQGLTIFLLLAIGWHGGEELAKLPPSMYGQALGFMLVGFVTNTVIGVVAYFILRGFTKLRHIDAATVAAYYGSDSAGTFVTCQGILVAANIAFAAYMPVMLAVMEIPGCLVALFIISRLRRQAMDAAGNMPGEPNYQAPSATRIAPTRSDNEAEDADELGSAPEKGELVGAAVGTETTAVGMRIRPAGRRPAHAAVRSHGDAHRGHSRGFSDPHRGDGNRNEPPDEEQQEAALASEEELALQTIPPETPTVSKSHGAFSPEMLHEVFLNPGIYLLFAGIVIGFVSTLQGHEVIKAGDRLFNELFQGLLCLFLLEMGITASRKLRDVLQGGWQFIAFAILAPNVFATSGILIAHAYSLVTGTPLELGTYVLFAVLCGAASYIAVPAVQRMAIPEASPTLPLAASLGLTFSYNVTIGIPIYMLIAKAVSGAA